MAPLYFLALWVVVADGLLVPGPRVRKRRISPRLAMSTATYPTTVSAASTHDFAYLKGLEDRVNRLSGEESDCLLSFWTDKLKCFQIAPQIATHRVSITTTCLSINTILANPRHWAGRARWDPVPVDSSSGDRASLISLSDACQALTTAAWSGDAFQV